MGSRDRIDHLPGMADLIASAETCAMCQILLRNISSEQRKEIMDRVLARSYSKLIICWRLDSVAEKVLGPHSVMHLEVSTRDKCFISAPFVVVPSEGQWISVSPHLIDRSLAAE